MFIYIALILIAIIVHYIYNDYQKELEKKKQEELEKKRLEEQRAKYAKAHKTLYPTLYTEIEYKGESLLLRPNEELLIARYIPEDDDTTWLYKSIQLKDNTVLDLILRYSGVQAFKVKDYKFVNNVKDLKFFFNTQIPEDLQDYLEIKESNIRVKELYIRIAKIDMTDVPNDWPVDCVMSRWSEWTECCNLENNPVGKDVFTQTRTREILQEPNEFGEKCPAEMEETKECDKYSCNIDCEVTEWEDWSKCSKDCKVGTQSRKRTIKTEPEYEGKVCPGLVEIRECNDDISCDCQVTEWTEWGECSEPCEGGIQKRTREITRRELHDGEKCPHLEEEQVCNEKVICPESMRYIYQINKDVQYKYYLSLIQVIEDAYKGVITNDGLKIGYLDRSNNNKGVLGIRDNVFKKFNMTDFKSTLTNFSKDGKWWMTISHQSSIIYPVTDKFGDAVFNQVYTLVNDVSPDGSVIASEWGGVLHLYKRNEQGVWTKVSNNEYYFGHKATSTGNNGKVWMCNNNRIFTRHTSVNEQNSTRGPFSIKIRTLLDDGTIPEETTISLGGTSLITGNLIPNVCIDDEGKRLAFRYYGEENLRVYTEIESKWDYITITKPSDVEAFGKSCEISGDGNRLFVSADENIIIYDFVNNEWKNIELIENVYTIDSDYNGDNFVVSRYNSSNNNWEINVYNLRKVKHEKDTKLCLAPENDNILAQIQLEPCYSDKNRHRWYYNPEKRTFTWINNQNLCLAKSGTGLMINECNDADPNMQWELDIDYNEKQIDYTDFSTDGDSDGFSLEEKGKGIKLKPYLKSKIQTDNTCLNRTDVTKTVMGECNQDWEINFEMDQKKQDCKMTDWSDWTKCSHHCGAGKQYRYRDIETIPFLDGMSCPENLFEGRDCTFPCPKLFKEDGIHEVIIPDGIYKITVKLFGGNGNNRSLQGPTIGGGGSFVESTLDTKPGTKYYITINVLKGGVGNDTIANRYNHHAHQYIVGVEGSGGSATTLHVLLDGKYYVKAVAAGGGGAGGYHIGGYGWYGSGGGGDNVGYGRGSSSVMEDRLKSDNVGRPGKDGLGGDSIFNKGEDFTNPVTDLNQMTGRGGNAVEYNGTYSGAGGAGYGGGGSSRTTGGSGGGSLGDIIIPGDSPSWDKLHGGRNDYYYSTGAKAVVIFE